MVPKHNEGQTSPYYQPENSVATMKLRILQHLDLMRMPAESQHTDKCSRECHMMERNHTIEAIKHFISNVQAIGG